MQAVTPELEALLKSKLQIGDSAFRARFEIDSPAIVPVVYDPTVYGPRWLLEFEDDTGQFVDTSGNNVIVTVGGSPTPISSPYGGGTQGMAFTSGDSLELAFVAGMNPPSYTTGPDFTEATIVTYFRTTETGFVRFMQNRGGDGGVCLQLGIGAGGFGSGAGQINAYFNDTSFWVGIHTDDTYNDGEWHRVYATWEGQAGVAISPSQIKIFVDGLQVATTSDSVVGSRTAPIHGHNAMTLMDLNQDCDVDVMAWYEIALTPEEIMLDYLGVSGADLGGETVITTTSIVPKSVSIDKSLRLVADSCTAEFANELLPLGWGPSSLFVTNSRCRVFQWYGDPANEVQVFTGVLDDHKDHRDVTTTTVALRDMMAILIDQTFGATAPQGADEAGAVRTPANGVYLSMEVAAILDDILDRAGWPEDDRDITPTSYVLDEFVIQDGTSWADAIIGEAQLTGLVGYSAWADEFGVFHFAPTSISQNLTEPVQSVYTYEAGVDLVSLDDETDQYELYTRIKVRGPLTTQTLEDTWRELWRTSKITKPVGIWYDPATPTYIRVLSRATKRVYKLRQSDRVVLSSVYLGSVIPYPLGISGDPADSTIYWVLNCPWIYTGSTSGNSVKKVRKSDNHVLASYSIPDGRWSAIKVSSSYMYLTNLDTDRFYRRDKSDASAIASYQHTYSSNLQANPSGLMIDGTTLYLFWSNGGTTARFLKCDESAPGTVTGVVKTAGTTLHGGEMDTTTHTECYGDSDSLNLTAKFTLLAAVDQTTEVYAEIVDADLEDELGLLAQLESRDHDADDTDPHPFMIRRLTLDLAVITSLAQATETATRQLDLHNQRKRVLDAGVIGNPALQKTDPIEIIDPVTGLSDTFVIDTYRTVMGDTYIGTLALLPVTDIDDVPDDDGDATE